MSGCPHADIRFCPLYHAAHDGGLCDLGCDDGKLDMWEGCAVARGFNYRKAIELLRIRRPGFVERIAWNEEAEKMRVQRSRNLALNGVH